MTSDQPKPTGHVGDEPRQPTTVDGPFRPRCCCVDGGAEPTQDGRCSRCWGQVPSAGEVK